MQSSFKTSLILFSALMACASNLSTASYQTKPLSCRADKSMKIVTSVGSVASMRLGQNYELGEGVSQDNNQAFDWYCNAAMQNSADAQLKIALFLFEGKGNQKDVSTGLEWLNRAANNGSHDAELALGILLVDTDAIRSAVLFKRAAAGGNLYANHRLAELYYYGMGVPQNYHKAQELSELGVAAGFEKSKELLTRIQIKQASGVFQSDQAVADIEPVVKAESVIKVEHVVKAESVVKVEEQPQLPKEPRIALVNEEQKQPQNNSLLQRFLSILPSLPNAVGNGAAPSEVSVTTSRAVDIKQPEAQLPSAVVSPPAHIQEVITHPVNVKPVVSVSKVSVSKASVSKASVSEIAQADAENNLPVMDKKTLQDQLVAAANRDIEEESVQGNEQETVRVRPAISEKTELALVDKNAGSNDHARNADWINKQPDMRYAIQLVQATHLDGIFKFIKMHDLDENAYYIHAQQDGEYRYILLYGNYPNNRTSKKVAKTLPDAVQKAGYWIRTFGDLRRSYVISP